MIHRIGMWMGCGLLAATSLTWANDGHGKTQPKREGTHEEKAKDHGTGKPTSEPHAEKAKKGH